MFVTWRRIDWYAIWSIIQQYTILYLYSILVYDMQYNQKYSKIQQYLLICNNLGQHRSPRDLDPRSNFEVDFKVKLYIVRRARKTETRWCKNRLPIFPKSSYFWKKKTFSKNSIILNLMTSGVLTPNHWPHLNSDEKTLPGLFQGWCFFYICSMMVLEILTIIFRYTRILGKFDVWWPLVT